MKKPRNRVYETGANHPRWLGGPREKVCQHCGGIFGIGKQPITSFKERKFCSKRCADIGGFRYSGKDHPNYREDARRRNRGHGHKKWVNAVFSRDKMTCQRCGKVGGELHAHHLKPWETHPELRADIDNGITLCFRCHWAEHTALNENAINSVNTLTDKAEGNTEPSLDGNILEGVTTRGRAYRRWTGNCSWCETFISKPLSDTKGKAALFCGVSCRSKWISANRKRQGGKFLHEDGARKR